MSPIDSAGWSLLRNVYDPPRLALLRDATAKLAQLEDVAVRGKEGAVYAARNVLDLCPEVIKLWRTPALVNVVREVCGPHAGLIRGLFFDKPPQQTWALPWHKDLLIAVRDDRVINGYSRPRLRAGVWHSEPPVEVLQSMLTLRIHLDAMTDDNGPLEVLTGSHVTGKELRIAEFRAERIRCAAGDVLAMHPLLVHSSGRSKPDCGQHRRVLHLEFSGVRDLPGGMEWASFNSLDA